MEAVSGIGGVFFRAKDPEGLKRWYAEHLGVAPAPASYDEDCWRQEAGPTAWAPFCGHHRLFWPATADVDDQFPRT